MNKNRKKELKLGVFLLVGVLTVLAVLEFGNTLPFISNNRHLNIYFDSAAGLEEGTLVKMEGVRVGNVESIGFSEGGDKIKVKIGIRRDAPVREGTVASIRISSLLGTNYINLSIADPSNPLLPDPVSLNGESPHNFDKIIQDAGILMSEASQAAARLNSILAKVDRGEGTVGKLVNEDNLYLSAKDALLKANTSLDTIEDLAPVSFIASALGVAAAFQ